MTRHQRAGRSRTLMLVVTLAVVGSLLATSELVAHAAATPTYKQSADKEITAGTAISQAFKNANVAGDLIVVRVIWSNTSTVSVADTRGNVYAPAGARTTWNTSWSSQIFYAKNVAAGSNTVTATFTTAIASSATLQIHEYSGIDKTNPLDGSTAATGSGTAMTSGTLTTTNANDLIFGAGASAGDMAAIGSAYTRRLNTSGNKTMDRTVTAAGSYSAAAVNSGGAWALQLVAFKADAGLDTTPPSASMSAPAQGATVSGTVTVSANAADNVAVASVEFLLDGVSLSIDTTAPYSVQWDTTTTSDGLHSLSARARDAAGNFGVTSGSFRVTVSNSTSSPLPPDLMAGWAFNEGTGTTSTDVSGNGNTLTLVNGPAWVAGKYGTGVKFDKIDDRVRALNSPTLNLSGTALTISTWINPLAGGGDQELLGKFWNADMTSPYYQYGIELHSGGTMPIFELGTAAGLQQISMGSSLPTGQWSHLAVTFDGSTVRFYVNGSLTSSSPLTATMTARDTVLHLGADTSPSQFFNGSLDEMRIYKRTLTQAQIQSDMSTALPTTTDPTAPTVIIDSPVSGAQVGGQVTITADAHDDTGVAGVQFFVDGTALGPEDTVEPYAANWDTRVGTNGAHTLTARARDVAGHLTVSTPVAVNVANSDFFQNEVLATGFDLPTAMKFLPDGRMLVAELRGKIKIVPPPYTTPSPTPFLQLTNLGTLNLVQQGIFDLAIDPSYSTNHYFYVFYTASTGGHDKDRLSRFTANATSTGTIAGSEVVLYQDPGDSTDEHHGGAIAFANDGRIFFTTGEHFQGTPAQDLTSPRGKVHRINADGTVPTDNPFYDGAGPNWDSVWAYGLRNPYRASYDAPTGRLLIGDVGGNVPTSNEEVDLGVRGANYGWPDSEGDCSSPCTSPLYTYEHNGRDAAITGGFVYRGSQFPSSMQGSYFFADYAQNWIRRLTFDANGKVNGVFNFEPADDTVDGPTGDVVYLTEGPEGSLYYLDLGYSDVTGTFGVSKVRRIRYAQSNQAPISVAAANPAAGPQPLTVSFSSAGSNDPEGKPITYSWDFGDGTALSTAANPTHVYTQPGQYLVRLTVSDGVNNTFSTPVTISVGNAPVATITSPADGLTFRAGNVISYSGAATDVEDGTLPASAFAWTIDFLHDGHVHPGVTTTGVKSGTFTIPTSGHDFSGNTRYRITLKVTDSTGLQDTKSVTIWPQKVNLTFSSAPTGLTLYLDGIAKTAPFTYDTLIGFQHSIEARNQSSGSTSYVFGSWSDGGGQTHTIVVPATAASYSATYSAVQAPNGLMGAWGFNEGTGTSTADASGNGNVGTLVNGLGWGTGKYGAGLSFDGTNDYLSASSSASLDVSGNALTLSMWLNPSTTSSGDQVVIGKHWTTTMTSPYYQYGLELHNNGSQPAFFVGTPSGVVSATMGTSLTKGQWSHLAVVFNGTTVQFYVNGVLVSTGNLTATITARGNPLRVGSDVSGDQFYKGLLDNLRIYNRALSTPDVVADMNAGV